MPGWGVVIVCLVGCLVLASLVVWWQKVEQSAVEQEEDDAKKLDELVAKLGISAAHHKGEPPNDAQEHHEREAKEKEMDEQAEKGRQRRHDLGMDADKDN